VGITVRVGVIAGGEGISVEVDEGTALSVGTTLAAGAHEATIKGTSKTVMMFLIFIDTFLCKGLPKGLRSRTALWGVLLGRAWTMLGSRKNLRIRKLVHAVLGGFLKIYTGFFAIKIRHQFCTRE
jgi:hypothetical protein